MTDKRAVAIIVLLQLCAFYVIRPGGNFPINDDWAFAHSAIWFSEEGRIRLSDWTAPNIVPQTVLGGTLTALFGFSFELLRHLTQLISLLTGLVIFYFFRSGRLDPQQSLVASLVVVAMPSWWVLANSYMTDMYGLLFGMAAAALFLRAFSTGSAKGIAAATVVVCIGVLQRQVLLVIPFAFGLGWLWRERRFSVPALLIATGPLLAALATEVFFYLYLASGQGIPEAQDFVNKRFIPMLLATLRGDAGLRTYVWDNFLTMMSYLGWFTAAWFAWWGLDPNSRPKRLLIVIAVAAVAALMQVTQWLPPYLANNTIDRAGIGPFTVYDGLPRELANLDRSPGVVWRIAGLVAAFGVVALAQLVISLLRRLPGTATSRDGRRVFLAVCIIGSVGPFIITGYFDRYLLLVIPFIILLWAQTHEQRIAAATRRVSRLAALAWVTWITSASVVATHDYFAWNRARWAAIELAVGLGATPDTLDGGFEYNGFHRFETLPRKRYPGKSFWWVKGDEFAVTFSEVPGYSLVREFTVDRIGSRTPPVVRLNRRNTGAAPEDDPG